MMPQGEWIINMLLADKQKGLTNINWDIAPMPVWEGQDPGVTWGQYQFVSIANDTAYPKEAFNFIQFLCGEQGARIYAQNGMIHAYSNDKIKQIYLNTVGKKSASYFFEAKKVQEQLAVTGYAEVTEAFKVISKDYLSGKITIDEAMAKLEKQRAKILNP
jgi:multiple sugar transport system substrate-binding protein